MTIKLTESMLNKLADHKLSLTYPRGTRIRLIHMDDPFNTSVKAGDKGTVIGVSDYIGIISMRWDNGSCLGLAPDVDKFEIIKEETK